jgi:hypothetical protein
MARLLGQASRAKTYYESKRIADEMEALLERAKEEVRTSDGAPKEATGLATPT